jgi:hypothetical protein
MAAFEPAKTLTQDQAVEIPGTPREAVAGGNYGGKSGESRGNSGMEKAVRSVNY